MRIVPYNESELDGHEWAHHLCVMLSLLDESGILVHNTGLGAACHDDANT